MWPVLWHLKQLIAPFLFHGLALSALRLKGGLEEDVGIGEFLLKRVIIVWWRENLEEYCKIGRRKISFIKVEWEPFKERNLLFLMS